MKREPSFRAVRWTRTFHLVAQAALLLVLFGGLNYLAGRNGWRLDLTSSHRHSLSDETRRYLANLRQPVRIICTLADDSGDDEVLAQVRRDLADLLGEYSRATDNQPVRVTTEFLNVDQRPREAKALGLEGQANVIVVLSGESGGTQRRRLVTLSDLYLVENREKKAFLGEQVLTAAILDVASQAKKKIYFLKGHGEMSPDGPGAVDADRGLSTLVTELAQRNLALASLDLSITGSIPADADLIVLAGPQGRLQPSEVELLRQYLRARAGRLLALLAPGYPHGLDALLDDWGILMDDVLVCDDGPAGQNDTGDLILTPAGDKDHRDHPVIRALATNQIPVRFGLARTARLDIGHKDDASLVVTELIGTARTAWGERSYREPGRPTYTAGTDLKLRDGMAVVTAAERINTRPDLPRLGVPGGRLVVFGGADWVSNGRLPALGNLTLFLAAVNWTVEPDTKLASVPARPIERLQLALTKVQLQRLRWLLVLALPAAAALLGLAVYWTRRR